MSSIWTKLRIAADPIARRFNLYTAYTIREDELIGTSDDTLEGLRQTLNQKGYSPQYLSAAKKHPNTGQPHDLSYRRVPSSHPPAAQGKRIQGLFRPQQCQFHVHAFELDSEIELFSHYEARPDFFSPKLDLNRLWTHFRPDYGQEYLRGITDLNR